MGRATVLATIAISVACTTLTAKPQAQLPRFEVASVRLLPNDGQYLLPSRRLTDTRVDVTAGLNIVLFWAFRAQYYEFQIFAPDWVNNDVRVEIQATMPPGTTVAQVPEMLQRLLAERFGMVVHRETRQMDGYELVVGPDGI